MWEKKSFCLQIRVRARPSVIWCWKKGLPTTLILVDPLIRLKWGASLDISHLYNPDDCGRICSSLILHLLSSHLNDWSASLTPSTVKFIYLGFISGVYLQKNKTLECSCLRRKIEIDREVTDHCIKHVQKFSKCNKTANELIILIFEITRE